MAPRPPVPSAGARGTLLPGLLSTALSIVALAWRGRADSGSTAAPLNAVSHMWWGDQALRRDDVSAAHTLLGATLHAASALFWAGLYDWVRRQRDEPTLANALVDAAALTAIAAVVDYKVVPRRLTPGFERRLSQASLAAVYAALGVGLALGDALVSRRRRG